MSATVAIIIWYPRTYRSEAELLVRVGRESVTLDPTATTGATVDVFEPREYEINSVVQMLGSRAIVEKAVDGLGPEVVLGSDAAAEPADAPQPDSLKSRLGDALHQTSEFVSNLDPVDNRQRAITKIRDSLEVYATKNSSVITLQYHDDTPEQAQHVVAKVLDIYMDEHVRVNRIAGSEEFFEEQSTLMETGWRSASERLRDLKNELGIVSVEAERNLLEGEMNRLDELLVFASTSHAASEAKIRELERAINEMPANLVTSKESGFSNEALDGMREKLYELEIKERELLIKFTEAHPEVINTRGQVEHARMILSDQEKDRTRSTTAVNPAREKLELSLKTERADAEAFAARVEKLTAAMERVAGKVKSLNDNEVRISELQQEMEIAQRNYLVHADKLEQARIDGALEDDRISNVNIVQHASFESKPASPRKGIVAALGLAIGLLGSLVIVIVSEQMDGSLRTPEDVEEQLDLAVLASLPRTSGNRVTVSNN
jgi:uncharacterized protein involved in exopolysaccharide biosynthesis